MKIIVKQIQYSSQEYDEALALRTEILRDPLGLTFSDEQLISEEQEYHIAVFAEGKLAGCLLLKPVSDSIIQMRQVAVAKNLQGKNIGSHMITFAEKFIREKGFKQIILHAREVVVPFYKKQGYNCEGDVFIEVTIPHQTMTKEIQ